MSQLFTILDDKIVINKALLRYVEGPTSLTGSLEILGGASVQDNLIVKGKIVADVDPKVTSAMDVGLYMAGSRPASAVNA